MSTSTRPEQQDDLKRLSAFALGELKRQRDASDIILQLCERTGWDWDQAEQFLESVRVDNQFQLAANQSHRYIFISLLLIAGGVLNIAVVFLRAIYNPRTGELIVPNNLEQSIIFLINQLGWISFPHLAYLFNTLLITGICMIIGGVIGLVVNTFRAGW